MQEGQCIGSREGLRKLRTTTPYGQTGLHTQLSSYPTLSMASMIDLHGSLLCTGSPQFYDLPGSASNFHRYFPMGSQSHILQPLIHIPSPASPSSQRLLCFLHPILDIGVMEQRPLYSSPKSSGCCVATHHLQPTHCPSR